MNSISGKTKEMMRAAYLIVANKCIRNDQIKNHLELRIPIPD